MVIGEGRYPESHLAFPDWDGPEMPFPGLPPSESPAPVQFISQGARGGRGWAWASLRGRMSFIQVPGMGGGGWCPPPALHRRGWVSVHLQCSCRAGVGARAPLAELGAENNSCASQGPVSFLGAGWTEVASRVNQSARSTCQHTEPEVGWALLPSRRSLHGPRLPWTQCVAICLLCMS